MHKILTLLESLYDKLLKFNVKLIGISSCKTLGERCEGRDVIVSLTSYGRRIDSVYPACKQRVKRVI